MASVETGPHATDGMPQVKVHPPHHVALWSAVVARQSTLVTASMEPICSGVIHTDGVARVRLNVHLTVLVAALWCKVQGRRVGCLEGLCSDV